MAESSWPFMGRIVRGGLLTGFLTLSSALQGSSARTCGLALESLLARPHSYPPGVSLYAVSEQEPGVKEHVSSTQRSPSHDLCASSILACAVTS